MVSFSNICKTASDKFINISVQCFPQDIYSFFFGWGGKASETVFRPCDIN